MSLESQASVRRRPGRPAKRQLIVEAARRVFLRHGYADTSLDAVAAEAGVSKQTIYNHFAGKEQLFAAVVQSVQQTAITASETLFAEQFEETGDLDRDLRAVCRVMVRLMLRGDIAAFRRLVISEQLRHPELAREWTRKRSGFESALVEGIEREIARGTIEVPDPDRAARQLILLVFNEAMNQAQFGLRELPDTELDTIIDDGIDLWLRAYRRRE